MAKWKTEVKTTKMIQFKIKREDLLKPLQMVCNIAEKRQVMPILSHILLVIKESGLELTGTDVEVAIQSTTYLREPPLSCGKLTLSGRKLLDICRNLPAEAVLEFQEEENQCIICSENSRFSLLTLPAEEFPEFNEETPNYIEVGLLQKDLLRLFQLTAFAIAQKDVRYYLNGMLLEILNDQLTLVATDGHRVAWNRRDQLAVHFPQKLSMIIPRKSVLELSRLLGAPSEEATIKLLLGPSHISIKGEDFSFISRLIDGQFPNYEQTIPRQTGKTFLTSKNLLKQALVRVSILSNERLPGIYLYLENNCLKLLAKNSEKEQAKEEIQIHYSDTPMRVGFNASYLIDVLNVIASDVVKLTFFNSDNAFLIEEHERMPGWFSLFVIMPIRL